jgi:hypothetical protein
MKLLAAKQWKKCFTKRNQISNQHLQGNSNAHFSITGEHHYRAKNNRWVLIACGAIHDEIAKQMPELAPLLLVHLADQNGVPMHAYENAGYWAGQTKYQNLILKRLQII